MNIIKKIKDYKLSICIFILLLSIFLVGGIIATSARYSSTNTIGTINLSIIPPPKTLMDGSELNKKIKDTSSVEVLDTIVNKIIFDYWSEGYIEGDSVIYDKTEWQDGMAIDEEGKGSIKLFKSEDGSVVYILSESDIYANIDSSNMFYGFNAVTQIVFNNFNTSNVELMNGMFALCESIKILDISSYDTANVVNMEKMFNQDKELTTIYVSDKWNTEKVNHSEILEEEQPFWGCEKLVGDMGTMYDSNHVDITYACIDGGEDGKTPGYLTFKDESITILIEDDELRKQEETQEYVQDNLEEQIKDQTEEENENIEDQMEEEEIEQRTEGNSEENEQYKMNALNEVN